MATCHSCGSSVPEGQNFCSMCYGDIDYGKDGYYRDYMEGWLREQWEREEMLARQWDDLYEQELAGEEGEG